MKNLVLYGVAIAALSACSFLGPLKEQTYETQVANDAASEVISETTNSFVNRTSREDLFMIIDMAEETYREFELTKPYPQLRIIDHNHPHHVRGMFARAVVFESGKRIVYIDRSVLNSSKYALRGNIRHEVAHFKTGEVYGVMATATHDKRFQKICRTTISRRFCGRTESLRG